MGQRLHFGISKSTKRISSILDASVIPPNAMDKFVSHNSQFVLFSTEPAIFKSALTVGNVSVKVLAASCSSASRSQSESDSLEDKLFHKLVSVCAAMSTIPTRSTTR